MSAISCQLSAFSKRQMNYPAEEQQGVRCHAGPEKPAPAIRKPGASSYDFWIPAFAGMTTRRKRRKIKPKVIKNKVLAG
jgi:hypothetical protein